MNPPPSTVPPELAWFTDARFGIFIHWGIWSVGQYDASWPFFKHGDRSGRYGDPSDFVSYEDYMAQRHVFNARKYDPDAWASLVAESGARYAVLTTKHHDGVALWDTAEGLSTVRDTPARTDLVAPFCAALRRHGLRTGLYYSHLDWSHPDYASVFKADGQPPAFLGDPAYPGLRFSYPMGGRESPERWERFLRFHRLQLRELCDRFSPDLLWFDGDWERTPSQWRFTELVADLRTWRPGVLLNNRLGGHGEYHDSAHSHGDFLTPEQGQPMTPPAGPWEFCVTMNQLWGAASEPNYKSAEELIRLLAECAGMGGNLLLNISPLADGTIHPAQEARLRAIGEWLRPRAEAIHGTVAGLPPGCFYGPSTLSSDRTVLYLIHFGIPTGEIAVKGIRNRIRSATVLGHGASLGHRTSGGAGWLNIPGTRWIRLPAEACHPHGTVIRLELEGTLDLYTGKGQVITGN